jgi:hypothetical protein
MVDETRVDKGCVSRDAHHYIGSGLGRSQSEARQDILLGSADARYALLAAKIGHDVVGGIRRGSHGDIRDGSATAEAMNHMP